MGLKKHNELAKKLAAKLPPLDSATKQRIENQRRRAERKSKQVTQNEVIRKVLTRTRKLPELAFVSERSVRKIIRMLDAARAEYLALGYEVPIPKAGKLRVEVRKPPNRGKLPNQAKPADYEAQLCAKGTSGLKQAAKHQKRMGAREEQARKDWERKQKRA